MNYAIMRTAKLKSSASVAASAQHTFRERATPNADARRSHLNEHFGANRSAELLERLNSLLPAKRRADAVLCIEHFFGASPEWWDTAAPRMRQQFFDQSFRWLRDTYGANNVLHFGTQVDESTPHAVAYVVPIRNGKLNAKSWLGGKEKLSELQDSYAQALSSVGLERGVKGSTAEHERVQRFYGIMRDGSERARSALDKFEPQDLKTEMELQNYARALEYAVESLEIELEARKREKRVKVSEELYEETGLYLAQFDFNYVGKIVVLARDFCIQKVVGIGLVLHSLKQFVEDAWHDYLDALFKGRDEVNFEYDARGKAKISESAAGSGAELVRRDAIEFE